jgi:hypothetical protein
MISESGGLDDEILILGELRRQGLAKELVPEIGRAHV